MLSNIHLQLVDEVYNVHLDLLIDNTPDVDDGGSGDLLHLLECSRILMICRKIKNNVVLSELESVIYKQCCVELVQ